MPTTEFPDAAVETDPVTVLTQMADYHRRAVHKEWEHPQRVAAHKRRVEACLAGIAALQALKRGPA